MSVVVDFPHHEISLVIAGQQIKGWEKYEIVTSLLEPANHFTVRMPFDRDAWDLCKTDSEVKVLVDDVVIMRGWIDDREIPEDEEVLEVVGRSRASRLVDESSPGIDFAGADVFTLIGKVAAPWFPKVITSNATNRTILRGRGKKAKAFDRAVVLHTKKSVGTHVQPGTARWQVIETLCAQAGYIAFETGDGSALFVGEPNYDQEIQYYFFQPAAGSKRTAESTVRALGVRESTAQRYSRIIVVGSGPGTDANYGSAVASRYAESKDNPDDPEGVGISFTEPKRLIQQRAVQSIAEAQELADREMARRDIYAQMLTARASGHGQILGGVYPTLFTYDTIAAVEDERTGIAGLFYVTGCTYRSERKGGEETLLQLVPKGVRLVS